MKTKQELYKSFMKANKQRREKMANNAGFNSASEFKAHLLRGIEEDKNAPKKKSKPKAKKKKPVIDTIHNVYILDRSGSMGSTQYSESRISVALNGINNEIEEAKKDNDFENLQTIVHFDTEIVTAMSRVFVNSIKKPFRVSGRGLTALNEAVGETLEKLIPKAQSNEKTIVKVFTDGGENASHGKYAEASSVAEIIKKAEDAGFTVTFVGTQQEVSYAIRNFKVRKSNTMTHQNTKESIEYSFQQTRSATASYKSKVMKGEAVLDGFYKQTGTLEDEE